MPKRALVVDDDRHMTKTLGDLLALKGWEVATAHSGPAAVETAGREPFDVVVMDVRMPGMDGVDAFKAMKAIRPGIRVVLMTAYAAPDRLAEAEREGVITVLSKPLDVPKLLAVLAGTLSDSCPVLLIDDDDTFLHTLSEVLRLHGFEVVTARDVSHATTLLAERKPLAVLLHMPLGSSRARDAVMAVHESNPHVALILYSGMRAEAGPAVAGVPREWVHAYLRKPFAVEQVTGVLDALRENDC